jgi:hypothetical protein
VAATDYALLVGINDYSKLTKLRGAEADALAVKEWLIDPDGGHVPPCHIRTILSSDYPIPDHPTKAKPMSDDVRAELERLIDDSQPSLRLGRRLYLYLAGHGFSPTIDETALLMANASVATLHHLPCVRYANAFRESTVFKEIVLVMDCCRDHYERPPLVDLGLPPIAVPNTDASYFFAFATKWSLKTREGSDPSGIVRGHFTRALVEALDQPSATSRSVAKYIRGRLPELAAQDGYYEPVFRCGKAIAFGKRVRKDAEGFDCVVQVHFAVTRRRVTLRILDSEERIVAEKRTNESPWSLSLPRGLYELRRADRPKQRTPFRVPPNGTIDVEA